MKKLLTESFLLACIPALAHMAAYLHEYGYCSYFWIPQDFIVVNLTATFTSLGILIILALTLFMFTEQLRLTFPRRIFLVDTIFLKFTPLFLIGIATIIKPPFLWINFWIWLFFVVLLAATELILPIFAPTTRSGTTVSYEDKLRESYQARDEVMKHMLLSRLSRLEGGIPFIIVIWTLCFLNLSFAFGQAYAANQRNFLVFQNQQNVLILRMYGDYMVCAAYNPKTHSLSGPITTRKFDEEGKTALLYRRIGVVKPPIESGLSK